MAHVHYLKFKINQLLQEKMILILETIAIFILALFVSIFLPQLLFQFLYSKQQLTAEPALLQYIPVISFSVAILYFLYATISVVLKKLKVVQLQKELTMLISDGAVDCMCEHNDEDLDSNDEIVKPVMSKSSTASKKKAVVKKKTGKKA